MLKSQKMKGKNFRLFFPKKNVKSCFHKASMRIYFVNTRILSFQPYAVKVLPKITKNM